MGECIFFLVEKVNVNVLSYFYYISTDLGDAAAVCVSLLWRERVREEAVEKEERGKRGGRC